MSRPRKKEREPKAVSAGPAAVLPPWKWKYEPDENPKRRHAWGKPKPGFVKVRGSLIGKCPAGFSNEEAEKLLNNGIPYPLERWGKPWPSRIYGVHEGTVYRATVTVGGRSYHAFPELPDRLRELPRKFQEKLLQRAAELGCEDQVRRWMNR